MSYFINLRKIGSSACRLWHILASPSLSLFFGQHCRFEKSCAIYTAEAIEAHGLLHGTYLGFRRILKCNPWSSVSTAESNQ
ncbi:membrane protein insertion efficiency factor YidD [bacterium]|nr:membrane protein insertion efficiency factor YidD [bacterium]